MAQRRASRPDSTPVRRQASLRSFPPSSSHSTTSFGVRQAIDQYGGKRSTLSSGAQSPVRGRTIHRTPAYSRSVSRGATRRRTILDVSHLEWENRLNLHDFAHISAEVDRTLLEPLPFEKSQTNLSEELRRAITFDESIDITRFAGHRDTFAMLDLRQLQDRGPVLPPTFFLHVAPYLDFDTYKAVRLTCYSWSVAISDARPINFAAVTMLPPEILEKVYLELSPTDFNAARHTCRAWMMTSLEEALLLLMVKRGGWSRAVIADKEVQAEQDLEYRTSAISDAWLLGKRLATECSLSPGWSGSGVRSVEPTTTGLRLSSQIDFSQLGAESAAPANEPPQTSFRFTVSACSRFMLAFQSCAIYIYALQQPLGGGNIQPYGGYLELWSTISCPARVLAVSMDTSFHRYAVAALLDGAVGIVCEPGPTSFSSTTLSTVPGVPSHQFWARAIGEATSRRSKSPLRGSSDWAFGGVSQQLSTCRTVYRTCSSSDATTGHGHRTIYRNLCSIDDPPCSVAISPQRRCVAFGSGKGIELHWVDALTGQDLSRWFPRPAPSDFLFFMRSNEDIGNAKNLRLISSARHPDASRNMQEDYQTYATLTEQMDHHGIEANASESMDPALQTCSRRHGVVPLSDGHHVLFVSSVSRNLRLAEIIHAGSTTRSLAKDIVFLGPKDEHGDSVPPHLYAAAIELRWGLRVVVAYSNQLWLFNVPPDVLSETRKIDASPIAEDSSTALRKIVGIEVATIIGIVSLVLDASAGDLILWAFSRDATANIFQLTGSSSKAVTQRSARSDGTIVLTQDEDGDTIMTEAPYVPQDSDSCSDETTSSRAHQKPSLVPCFPTCTHTYCNCLLDAVCRTLMTTAKGSPTSHDVQFGATSVHPDLPFLHTPCLPACAHRYCNLLLYADTSTMVTSPTNPRRLASNISITDTDPSASPTSPAESAERFSPPSFTPESEDEGYASAGEEEFEMAGGHFAIHVPPISSRWSEELDAEWMPDYLGENGIGVENEGLGSNLLEMCRCECEIVDI